MLRFGPKRTTGLPQINNRHVTPIISGPISDFVRLNRNRSMIRFAVRALNQTNVVGLSGQVYFNTIQAGAWSLAPSSPRTLRSTPALMRRGATLGLSNR